MRIPPTSSNNELSWDYPGWRVAGASALASMAGFGPILIYTFGIMLKSLTGEFGWSRETISTAFGCASFTLGLSSPGLGWLLDRYGPRRVIVPCVMLFGAAFASLSLLTNNRIQLFGTFILIGAVGNATSQMGFARAVSTWFQQHRGMALAVMIAGSTVGSVLTPFIAQRLIVNYGWRATYAILGSAPFLIALPLVIRFLREKTEHRTSRLVASMAGTPVAAALATRPFWILALTLFLTAMSTTGILTHLAALLTDRGVTAGGAAAAVSVVAGTGIIGRLITGWLLDRAFGPRVNMVLLFTTAAGLLLLSQAQSAASGLVAAALIGFSMGGESDVTPYLLGRYYGLRRFATLYGLTWTAYAVAAAMGSVLLGRAFDATGSYGVVLVRLAILVFIAGLLMLLMPQYPPKGAMEAREEASVVAPEIPLPERA
ncbi:MAG: MFS transporter [Bryobacteraceae bacterium]